MTTDGRMSSSGGGSTTNAYKYTGNADFSTMGSPKDHIDHYSLSLTGVFLHELHHALCDFTADVALKPPLTTGSGDLIVLAYAYYGTTELAYQVTSRSENSDWYGEYKLLYYNADSVNIIAVGKVHPLTPAHASVQLPSNFPVQSNNATHKPSPTEHKNSKPKEPQANSPNAEPSAIWLKGSAWHRGYARSYSGMPSAGSTSTSRKRSLPPQPRHNGTTTPPSQHQQTLDGAENTLRAIPKPELPTPQINLIGGPRYKSEGLDPTWFFGSMIPPAAVPDSGAKNSQRRKITSRVFVA
ncbi:MAG: hypothetical protein Q9182_001775 [Xanthomendoza sp. 2 TL-2023]